MTRILPTLKKINAENNYHALFEQARDGIFVTDFKGNFIDVNKAFSVMFGYTKKQLLQMNVKELLDKKHLKEKPIRFDLLQQGANMLTERTMFHRNGEMIIVEANSKKLMDDRVLVIVRDITERKKLEQVLIKSEADLHTILDTTDTIYVLMDKQLRILSYNPRAVDFAKKELNHDTYTGDYLLDYFSKERKGIVISHLKKGLAGQHVSYEANYTHDDGLVTWYHIRIFPVIRNKKVEGVMLVGTEITEKKLLQEKLLQTRIQEQKTVIRAVLNAQEIERNKIAQELHDNVNQILSTVRLFAGMLNNSKKTKELVSRIKDLIDMAISEIRVLSKENVTPQRKLDLKELIETLLIDLNSNTQLTTKFFCQVSGKLVICEDLKLNVYRIVQEQIHNILKYAGATKAAITVNHKDRTLTLTINDNGKGFDLAKKSKGIGLSNIANRVASYNGSFDIKTSPGKGCTLEIAIPLEPV